jgi:hypothetical protein
LGVGHVARHHLDYPNCRANRSRDHNVAWSKIVGAEQE